jgi:predicted O-linked N-acetylglucosamine transferase (SPINDLY family)
MTKLTLADGQSQAQSHRRAGRHDQAEAIYRHVLHDHPTDVDTWCHLGALCRDQQRFDEAADAYRRAIDLQPDQARLHNSLGIVYACWRRFHDAEKSFRRALELQPNYAKALNNLGNALSEQRKLEEAADAYVRARELGYDDPALFDSLGLVLARKGDLDRAADCFRKALAARPEDGGVLTRLAVVLARRGDLDDAAETMRRALRRRMPDAEVFFRLGDALSDKGKLDLAIRCFEKVLHERPNDHAALNHLATAQLQQGRLADATVNFRRAIAVRPDDLWSRSSLLFVRTNDPAAEPEEVFEEHCDWARLHAALPAVPPSFPNDRTPDRCLRIGYVSPDFRRHPVGRFMEAVLAAHDPNHVDLYCYDEAIRPPDEVTDRLRAVAAHWRVTKDKSHAQVAEIIRSDQIDILVDLAGHTGNNRLGAFALRPAPVQVTYLGYPNTTGLSAIDYVLVDEVTQPPSEPAWFAEEPVRLPAGFCCYAPRDDAPAPTALPAKSNSYLTFGAFHNLSKLNDAVLALWAKVLNAAPGAKLLVGRNTLSGETREELCRRFAAHGVAEDRLDLRQLVAGPAAFLETYQLVDISLDTFPWTGHTTACDSLWMGVPVLTLRGKTHAGRMVASVLTHVGLQDWIADTQELFVRRAAHWANNHDRLAEVRNGLRQRMRSSRLCDAAGFTRSLESAFDCMWRRWCARGQEPSTANDALARADQLRQKQQLSAAEDMYRLVVRMEPSRVEGWAWLGAVAQSLGKPHEAAAHYRRAIHLRPQDPRTHNSLGIVYAKLLQFPAAETAFRQALDLNPDYAKAHNNLGNTLSEQGKLDEAAASFSEADRLGYRDPVLHCNLAIVYSRQGFLDRAQKSFRTATRLDPANLAAQSALLFMRNYEPNADPEEVFAEHCRWGEQQMRGMSPRTRWANDRATERPLRVGYVSPDFRNHPVGRFFEPILSAHDPGQVQIFCYDEAPFPADAVTARLRSRAPNWRITRGQTDSKVSEWIQKDGVDILIDLAGHTAHNRLGVFALKPAPIQVTYLGYANTTGLQTMNYILTDAVAVPEDNQQRFVETPWRLPGGFSCFAPRPDAPAIEMLPASRNGYVTFGSTHGLIRLNGAVLDLWSEVLRAVPRSRLRIARDMLRGSARDYFCRQFRDRGIAEGRIELYSPPVATNSYWTLYHDIDVSLDTFPWSGHTTACESLWMGVPVVTLQGKTHAGRMVASVLMHSGLSDWIAASPSEYVALTAQWAGDTGRLAQVRAEMRQRLLGSTLCDAVGFTKKLEHAYRMMWRRWCQDEPRENTT